MTAVVRRAESLFATKAWVTLGPRWSAYADYMARFAAGSDHAGRSLKDALVAHLVANGHEVADLGAHDDTSVDYPDYGAMVARHVVAHPPTLGLCVCGSGIGISIAANKIPGARAALVHDVTTARLSRQHNDANVVCFGERLIGVETAKQSLDAFLAAAFEGGRHVGRVEKLAALDATSAGVTGS
jgi:ribose 5-phosphate isomerase B